MKVTQTFRMIPIRSKNNVNLVSVVFREVRKNKLDFHAYIDEKKGFQIQLMYIAQVQHLQALRANF